MEKFYKSVLILFFLTAFAFGVQAKPDLIISKVAVTKDASGFYVGSITVTVSNGCQGTNAGASYVLVTFKESERSDAKAIYYVGGSVKALKGGQSYTQTFDVAYNRIGIGRFVYIEADPYKKVAEASEENNWRTLFPDGAGAAASHAQCSS